MAWAFGVPPFSYQKTELASEVCTTNICGMFVELVEYVFKDLMKYKVDNQIYPWTRAQREVEKDKLDAHVTVKNPTREKFLLFQDDYIYQADIYIFYSENNPKGIEINKISKKDELKNYFQGIYRGSGWAKMTFPAAEGYKFEESDRVSNILKKIENGRIDLFVSDNILNVKSLIKELAIKDIKYRLVTFLGEPLQYKFCLRKSYPNSNMVMQDFNEKFSVAKKTGILQKIKKKYDID